MRESRCYLRSAVAVVVFTILMVLIAAGGSPAVYADEPGIPVPQNNLRYYLIKNSSIAATTGGYVRVFYDGSAVQVEEYNDSFELASRRTIDRELSIYGGFFSGSDAYYFVFGQNNTSEENSAEVIRVVKYDKNWNRIGAASINGDSQFAHQIRYPFDVGNVSMAEWNGILYIVTGHEGYVDPQYGQGHQGFLMLAVDEANMTGTIADADLWHSFSQHIAIKDGDHIYVFEESDGNSQSQISLRTAAQPSRETTITALKYGGEHTSAWSIPTYANADAIHVSDNNIIAVGQSIDQTRYSDETYSKTYNIYLTVTPIDSFTSDDTKLTWITNDNLSSMYRDIKLTKISNNRFMLMWERSGSEASIASEDDVDSMSSHVLHYVFLNGNGETVGDEFTVPAAISECEPIVKNGKVVFYSSDGASIAFYTIDTDTGAFSKRNYCVAGENAVWSYDDGVLTVSGTGALYDSLGSSGFSTIRDKVTKLVVEDGITDIGSQTFSNLTSLTEVSLSSTLKTIGQQAFKGCSSLTSIRLPRGVTSIGDKAFYSCDALRSFYVPKTVTSIGSDILWTGYTWTGSGGKVVRAKIFCEEESQALAYAEEQSISYETASMKPEDTTSDYTGSPVSVKTGTGGAGREFSLIYYTDKNCTAKTSSLDGASEAGAAPSEAGEYYVCAYADEDDVFEAYKSSPAHLVIHRYEVTGVADGVATLRCTACGEEKQGRVPTGFTLYWKTDPDSGSYSSFCPASQEVGDKLFYWIYGISYSASSDLTLNDMVVETEDPSAADIDTGEEIITWRKAGKQTINIYPKYNPSLKRTYNINVTQPPQPLGSAAVTADKEFPQQYGSEITFTASAEGGKGILSYRFVLLDDSDKEIVDSGYSGSDEWTWKADRTGSFRVRVDVKDAGDDDRTVSAQTDAFVIGKAPAPANAPKGTFSIPYSSAYVSDDLLAAYDNWAFDDSAKETELAVGVDTKMNVIYIGGDADCYETVSAVITVRRSTCEHEQTVIRNSKEATCTDAGYTGDTYCDICNEKLQSGTEIEPLGHEWGKASYTWADDNSTCTALRKCTRKGCTAEDTETVATTFEKVSATCVVSGRTIYTAVFTHEGIAAWKKSVETGTDPDAHSLVMHPETKATTTHAGNIEYWECADCGKCFSAEDGVFELEEGSWIIPKLQKKAQSMTAKGKTVKLKYSKLKKSAQYITAAKAMKISNAKGSKKYTLKGVSKSKFKKYFSINSSTGKIKVKKGLAKGTYKLTITVKAAGNSTYKSCTKTAKVTVKVQ